MSRPTCPSRRPPRAPAIVRAARCRSSATVAGPVLLAAFGLLAAACGGDPSSPGIASLGSRTTTTVAVSPGGPAATGTKGYAETLAYAQCMRSHGVPNFPDPNSDGDFLVQGNKVNGQAGVDPKSAAFQAADKACRHLLPNGGLMTQAEQQQAVSQLLKFVQCMRSHGVNMPDPSVTSQGIQMRLGGEGVDPSSPTFRAAQRACQSLMPGKP